MSNTSSQAADLAYADTHWKAAVAILAVERDHPNVKSKLPRDYARRGIEPLKLKSLIDLIANIGFKGDRSISRTTRLRVGLVGAAPR